MPFFLICGDHETFAVTPSWGFGREVNAALNLVRRDWMVRQAWSWKHFDTILLQHFYSVAVGWTWCQCTFRLFQNDLNAYKFVSQQVNTTDSGTFVFIDEFLSFSILSRDHTAFELRKLLRNWSSSYCALSKSYFQCLAKLLLPFPPSLQWNFVCCIGTVKKCFTSCATKVAVKFRSLSFCSPVNVWRTYYNLTPLISCFARANLMESECSK